MTAPQFADFVPPVQEDSDPFPPKDHYSKPLLVKVRELKPSIVTSNSPDGAPGLIVDVVDLTGRPKQPYRNVLWMGGAVVDGLKTYVGGPPLIIRFEPKKSNSGRTYPAPNNGSAEDKALGSKHYDTHGDPFAPQFADLNDEAPF